MTKHILPLLLFISFLSTGQNYQIKVELKAAADKEVFLAHYYIGKIYIDDTLKLDASGTGTFKGDTLLPQGLYKIYLDDKNHFDFLLGADQFFTLSNDSFLANSLKVTGSAENEEFVKYVVFLSEIQKKAATLKESFKNAGEEEKVKIEKQMSELTPALQGYWKDISKKYPNTFMAKFLMSNYVPTLDISTLPEKIQKNDSLLLRARFDYQKTHFWDYFDYTDERFLYTPLYSPKLETWYTKVLYQNYDSVKPFVFQFIEDVRPKKRIFQFVTSYFLNASINSDIMGMDALFVDLAQTYYLSGEAFWATEESLDKIKENVLFKEKSLIGMNAPDITLESVDGEYFNLYQVDADYTVLLIFEPDCSHCKEFVPEFHEKVYQKYKNEGLEVFCIYSMDKKDEWVEFLTKHNLYDWINVWDENHITRFKILYDARTTPGIFVLDKNKKIVAKKMTVDQLDRFMQRNLN